ncbi:MAG: isoaspartyl peptidase/L-asparaginase [Planctomycetes bacterium]|nr:isoaspartyl peptidase/L-asparaginase [Planctomycetota bacterium]
MLHCLRSLVSLLIVAQLFGCAAPSRSEAPTSATGTWALAIHGGVGTLERSASAAEQQEYLDALRAALEEGRARLARGESALDVCEAVVRVLEDDPHFNAGRGAAFNEQGQHELDASIMDGSTLACGAVAGVRTVKNPISLARLVMERTSHVLLMGDGAEQFASTVGVERVENAWFDTEPRRRMLDEVLRERAATSATAPNTARASNYGTVGCVVLDREGRLAAATSTGGLTGKRWGRVGDSPIPGAGNYADRYAAISGTGTGEVFLRHQVAKSIAARMELAGESLERAAHEVVHEVMRPGDGGVIGVDSAGRLLASYNTEGMYRGFADAAGRFELRIFE